MKKAMLQGTPLMKACPKARLCIASPFPPPFGGMAIQAEKLCTALEKDGWDVYRVAVNQHPGPALAWINRLPMIRTLLRMFLFLRALNAALNRCETVYLLSGFFDYFFWVSAPAILLAKARKKRIFLSARGGAAGKYFIRYGTFIRPFVRLLDGVTAPSPFLKDAFEQSFGIAAKIIPNIADLEQFHFQERSVIRPRLLCPRNLEPIYNVACAIRAFALVKRRIPDAVMGIAGDGSESARLKSLCCELGISDSVTFMGQISHSGMPAIYDGFDILINSSNEDNLPGVMLEAFAAGLPVVSTRVGGIPFLVTNETTGLLVDPNDIHALAHAVVRLVGEPALGRRIALRAREVCHAYSAEKAVRDLRNLLCPGERGPETQVL